MKSIILSLICVIFAASFSEAYTAYYYYGQYFRVTSKNTVELIKPIKSDDMTMKQEYTGDFNVQDFIVIDSDGYSVTKIADSAFVDTSITSLTLGQFVDSIGESACTNCTTLTAFISNDSLTYIGNDAFNGCKNLSKVVFSEGLSFIGDSAFSNCFISGELSIPSSVVSIGDFAFYAIRIHTLHLSSEELTIGAYAFEQASSLETINISSLTNWCNYIFISEKSNPLYYAKNLTLNGESIVDLDLSDEQITSVPIDAFIRQNTIQTIRLGSNIKTIGDKAFYTSSIRSIFVTSNIPPVIEENTFTYTTYRNAIVTVPVGYSQLYREAPYWSSFVNIVEAEDSSGTIEQNIINEQFRINRLTISANKPILMNIYTIDGRCLYNSVSDSYTFDSPGVYVINGAKYIIL